MVKGLIPLLEAVVPTYLQDLSPKGLLSLHHPHIIPILLGLILYLFDLL